MNKVILMGRLTRDPQVRYTQGQPLMVTVAYDTGKKDAEGNPIMAEHEVVNSQVERLAIIQDRYFKQCRQGAADFGLTVSSRCRLIIPKAPEAPKTNKFKDNGRCTQDSSSWI